MKNELLSLGCFLMEIYEFIYFHIIYIRDICIPYLYNEANKYEDINIALHYAFCNSSGDKSNGEGNYKKPYEGKGKGKATEEDLNRLEREEKGLPPESDEDVEGTGTKKKDREPSVESPEDIIKKKQEENDAFLAQLLQQEEEGEGGSLEEEEGKYKILQLENEVRKVRKQYNKEWNDIVSGNLPKEEESELKEKVSNLKKEYYNKSDELDEHKFLFGSKYGYTPKPQDVETESENSEADYYSSESEHPKVSSPQNLHSNNDPDVGPSRRNNKPKGDSDEERPHKKSKSSHDFSSDSKNYFLPIFYRLFSFKSFLSLIRIFLLTIPLCFPDFSLFIYYFYFIDLYIINLIVTNLEGAIFLHKIWKKIKFFCKISKFIIKFAYNHYIYTLTFLVLFFLIYLFL